MVQYALFPTKAAMQLGAAATSPVASLVGGLEHGVGAMQQFQQRRQQLQMGRQQLQMGQLVLQAEPQLLRNQLQQQAHILASQRLAEDKSSHGYVLSRLAELKGLPQDQMPAQYEQLRQHLIGQGIND
ncbi:MAG: hypothetical protein GWN00_15625, partial [Aliifodinibius sp.]|nr:hypothetical protein [Fodinibius sp.]NIV12493.1 hypothetical protein [Fodinibius sp.]NIY26181.1 hypothetical protein [Fodinibius sp.]